MTPETQYTRSGEVSIAYQVFGRGAIDLVLVPGWISNIELYWEQPDTARFFERLATFARVILFDNAAPTSRTGSPRRHDADIEAAAAERFDVCD